MSAAVHPAGTTPLRRATLDAARRLGVEDEIRRAYEGWRTLRAGPKALRNERDDRRIRLLAAGRLGEGSNVIDVGANEGKLLRSFLELAPRGDHIAYEPIPALADRLVEAFPGVEVRRAALSDQRGTASFVVHRELPSRSSLRPVGYSRDETEEIEVRLEDLDSALPAGYVPDLIKIDVEGAEQLVLEGARETLATHRPLVVFEHQRSTAEHYGTGPDELHALLAGELGMRIFDLDGHGPYSSADLRAVYRSGKRWNFVAS